MGQSQGDSSSADPVSLFDKSFTQEPIIFSDLKRIRMLSDEKKDMTG
jgi:hypothetical protein